MVSMRIIPQTQELVKYNGSQFSVVSSQQSVISKKVLANNLSTFGVLQARKIVTKMLLH